QFCSSHRLKLLNLIDPPIVEIRGLKAVRQYFSVAQLRNAANISNLAPMMSRVCPVLRQLRLLIPSLAKGNYMSVKMPSCRSQGELVATHSTPYPILPMFRSPQSTKCGFEVLVLDRKGVEAVANSQRNQDRLISRLSLRKRPKYR